MGLLNFVIFTLTSNHFFFLFKLFKLPTQLYLSSFHQLTTLQRMSDVINTKQLEDVFKNVESNTKYLVDASAANERSSAALDVMQVILAGSFAFDILDRLSGGTCLVRMMGGGISFFLVPRCFMHALIHFFVIFFIVRNIEYYGTGLD